MTAPADVYDGLRRLGSVEPRPDGRFNALDAQGVFLAVRDTMQDARQAVAEAQP